MCSIRFLIMSLSLTTIFLTLVLVGGANSDTTTTSPNPNNHNGPLLLDPSRMCRKGRKFRDSMNFIMPGKIVGGLGSSAGSLGSHRQRRKVSNFCTKEPEIVHEARRGAQLATMECQHQFKSRHWNCTALPRSIRKVLSRETRETAFVHAITSAGVTYTVTQACSSGQIHDCPCDRTALTGTKSPEGNWEWGGCGDQVHVGYQRSKDILDLKIRRRNDLRSLVLLHNNEAGRLAVRNHMKLVCKCHGLSGSCTLKTCWQKVPTFREVGERLKRKFDGAAKVIPGNDGKSVIPAISTIKTPDKEDLLYFDESDDYCHPNKKTGSLGTTGRTCNASSIGVDGCDLLCCGRGYTTKILRIKQNCRCRFKWCCEVTCETCIIRKVVHTCR